MPCTARSWRSWSWLDRGATRLGPLSRPPALRPTPPRGFRLLFNSSVSSANEALAGLVSVLGRIAPGRPPRSIVGTGHYASVLAIDDRTGVAICTDGVGTKV